MDELPLRPIAEPPSGTGIKQAIAVFSLSALLGASGSVGLVFKTRTACRGASRAAELRRAEARAELASRQKMLESEGSTPSR
jgi:hypothetical protein